MMQVEFRIVSCFFRKDSCRFTEICKAAGFPADLGGYYIRRLVSQGCLVKSRWGTYSITPKGKQQLLASYGNNLTMSRPRFCVVIVARQHGAYVILERDRQPFIDVSEWPAGLVLQGEVAADAAQRLSQERLGVTISLAHKGVFRRIDKYKDMIFDDKLFAVYTGDIPADTAVVSHGKTGKNTLYTADELSQITKPSRSLLDILAFASTDTTVFEEHVYHLRREDLFTDNLP